MLFNSLEFVFFFPLAVISYYLFPHKYRWLLLLLASYYFYMAWKPEYAFLLAVSTIIDYTCGIKMANLPNRQVRKPYLYVSLLSNLGLLFSFKYLDFSIETWNAVFGMQLPLAELVLPMGISFYTFQTMSYSIDIYKGGLKAEKHFGRFALFVAFFPQLVAGPIERASHLLPQTRRLVLFHYPAIVSGLRLMLWGFFKKVVVAERLAFFVEPIYRTPSNCQGLTLSLATIFFAFQIYCDFSGYSDIAIGTARVLGFDLKRNFNRPYAAKSLAGFWKRWHISLSDWFRDYVYIPLGGNRTVKWRWYYNLLITFVASGIWHGANWTFVIWGVLHGCGLVAYMLTRPLRNIFWTNIDSTPLRNIVAVVTTFGFVCFTWIFFRANSLEDAFFIATHLFTHSKPISAQFGIWWTAGLYPFTFAVSCSLILFLLVVEFLAVNYQILVQRFDASWLAPVAYAAFSLVVLALGVFNDGGSFIYFQF